tara:strand:+ start:268 stop:393 length:126 start_codon:yes stop_codon:yes gene_type:complete
MVEIALYTSMFYIQLGQCIGMDFEWEVKDVTVLLREMEIIK